MKKLKYNQTHMHIKNALTIPESKQIILNKLNYQS